MEDTLVTEKKAGQGSIGSLRWPCLTSAPALVLVGAPNDKGLGTDEFF